MISSLLISIVALLIFPVASAANQIPSRGMWVWHAAPLLHDLNARARFFDFCEEHGISSAAVQIEVSGTGEQRRLEDAASWRKLIDDAHRRGITVHALDGDPGYALRAHHDNVLSIVEAVISYNASVAPAERFDGINLDIEPYLLAEWNESGRRELLLAGYLEVHERAATRSRAAELVYSADIPFWWYAIDEVTAEPVSMTTFHGVRQPAIDHLLDIVHSVGLMVYRNVAAGPDGIIALAMPTIERAAAKNVRVFVGIETERVSDGVPSKATFYSKSLDEMNAELAAVEAALSTHASYTGIAFHQYGTFQLIAN